MLGLAASCPIGLQLSNLCTLGTRLLNIAILIDTHDQLKSNQLRLNSSRYHPIIIHVPGFCYLGKLKSVVRQQLIGLVNSESRRGSSRVKSLMTVLGFHGSMIRGCSLKDPIISRDKGLDLLTLAGEEIGIVEHSSILSRGSLGEVCGKASHEGNRSILTLTLTLNRDSLGEVGLGVSIANSILNSSVFSRILDNSFVDAAKIGANVNLDKLLISIMILSYVNFKH